MRSGGSSATVKQLLRTKGNVERLEKLATKLRDAGIACDLVDTNTKLTYTKCVRLQVDRSSLTKAREVLAQEM